MGKVVAFDTLRFIACIFVILHHVGINIYGFHQLDNSYFRTAGLAVEIFFVLSGFLLANSYQRNKEKGLSDSDSCTKYFFYISFIIGLLYFRREMLLKFLSWKCWEKVSHLSYTIYLTHLIVLEILRVYWKDLPYMNPVCVYTSVVMICLVFGYDCYYVQKWVFAKLRAILFVPQEQSAAIISNTPPPQHTIGVEGEKDSSCRVN